MSQALEDTYLITKIRVKPQKIHAFADWQARLNASIAAYPGFVSLEILSPTDQQNGDWGIVQRFYNVENASAWRASKDRKDLLEELQSLSIVEGTKAVRDEEGPFLEKGVVTEVFVIK